ncbi:MAG: HAD family phosphatase [Planctomycetota bacterium]
MSTSEPSLPPSPLKAVAFDLDGLLVNSEDVYENVGAEVLSRRGKRFEDDLRHAMMGRPAAAALQVMIDWHGLDDSIEALTLESEQVFWETARNGLACMPGAAELLDWMDERQVRRGLVTSGGRQYAERILEAFGIKDRFLFRITADDVHNGKPHPEPYLQAAERLGVSPAEMLVLEDSGAGSRAGVAAGAYTVAVPNRHTQGHDFAGVAYIASSLNDAHIRRVLGGG